MKISEVVVLDVSFSQAQEKMATLSTFLEQQSNVSELRSKFLPSKKSITLSCIQESHQTTIDSHFGH